MSIQRRIILISFLFLLVGTGPGSAQAPESETKALRVALSHARTIESGRFAIGRFVLDTRSDLKKEKLQILATATGAVLGELDDFFYCPDTPIPRCVSKQGVPMMVRVEDWRYTGEAAQVKLVMRYIVDSSPEEIWLVERVDRLHLERRGQRWKIVKVDPISIT